jgi:hypothetical protein
MEAEKSLPTGVAGCDGFILVENLEVILMFRQIAEREKAKAMNKEDQA